LERLEAENFGTFYGQFFFLYPFGIFNAIWYIFGQFSIFFNYILGIFSFLVCCTAKNLATLSDLKPAVVQAAVVVVLEAHAEEDDDEGTSPADASVLSKNKKINHDTNYFKEIKTNVHFKQL
jgi:hypothetical protein